MRLAHSLLCLAAFAALAGCGNNKNEQATSQKTKSAVGMQEQGQQTIGRIRYPIADTIKDKMPWVDSLVKMYIEHSTNDTIQVNWRYSNEDWEWYYFLKTDSAIYVAIVIGHQYEDTTQLRRADDAWICIDTVKRRIYEYDQNAGTLKRWRAKSSRK